MSRNQRAGWAPLVLAMAATAFLVLACQPRYGNYGDQEVATVSMRLRGTPPDATVTVDDERVGTLAVVMRRGLAVRPGRHRITVEHDGYFPWDGIVTASNALVRVDVVLQKVPE